MEYDMDTVNGAGGEGTAFPATPLEQCCIELVDVSGSELGHMHLAQKWLEVMSNETLRFSPSARRPLGG